MMGGGRQWEEEGSKRGTTPTQFLPWDGDDDDDDDDENAQETSTVSPGS
jgi:hypothetical protein